MSRLSFSLAALALTACASQPTMPPLPTVANVDLPRYMGDWFVIANIPPKIEKNAYNSVENYRLDEDGNVPTVFTYRKDSFEGKLKTLKSKGFIQDSSNATWGVQFIWPVKAEYLITYLSPGYTQAIVARNKRDYVWILARTPQISETNYAALRTRVAGMGYDMTKLQKVPQRWPDPGR